MKPRATLVVSEICLPVRRTEEMEGSSGNVFREAVCIMPVRISRTVAAFPWAYSIAMFASVVVLGKYKLSARFEHEVRQ